MAAKNGVSGQGESGGDEIQRWTAGRNAAVVLDVIKGRATPAELARQHDLTVGEIESWVEKFLEGGREGLRAVPRDSRPGSTSRRRTCSPRSASSRCRSTP